ncbi:hypothetical protein [Streptomyces sp. SM12]|uniref:hypothetical protein n=1 Tax=Streptomyces sp. SM12 TaxID=1071602 RepID=UPI000CD4A165|nr:hypothetical protein [Streptomyces sp. SM12]
MNTTTVLVVGAALLAGYVTGRARPGARLWGWALRDRTPRQPAWWIAQLVLAVPVAVLLTVRLVVRPRRTVAQLRARHRPPERSPAVRFFA